MQVLQNASRNAILMEEEEEFLFEDGGKGCFKVTKEYIGRGVKGGMAILDV